MLTQVRSGVNEMVPTRFNSSIWTKKETTDGETFNVVVYVRLKPGLGHGWTNDMEPQNAEQLLNRWDRAPRARGSRTLLRLTAQRLCNL